MEQQAYEEFDASAALDKEWHELYTAHSNLGDGDMDDPQCAEKLADVIAKLQAYGRVLRRMEKEIATRKLADYKKSVIVPASTASLSSVRVWENVD